MIRLWRGDSASQFGRRERPEVLHFECIDPVASGLLCTVKVQGVKNHSADQSGVRAETQDSSIVVP
jgi:hypothetical protein